MILMPLRKEVVHLISLNETASYGLFRLELGIAEEV